MEEKLLYSFEFIVEDIIDEVVKQTDNLKGSASSAEIVFKNRVKIVVEHMDNDMGIEDNHCVICQAFYPGADNFFIRNSCTSGDKYTAFKHSIKDFVFLAIKKYFRFQAA